MSNRSSESIPRNPVYPPALDWAFLRQEGIRYIERLGSAVWTDYNLHDPGITMLEVFCYALTDLGFRTRMLENRDLFSADPASKRKMFFTAAEVLSCAPVTANDFRRVLIDLNGVKNAWIRKVCKGEQEIFSVSSQKQDLENLLNNLPQAILDSIEMNTIINFVSTIEALLVFINRENNLVVEKEKWSSLFGRARLALEDALMSFEKGDTNASWEKTNRVIYKLLKYFKKNGKPVLLGCELTFENSGSPDKLPLNGLFNVVIELEDGIEPTSARTDNILAAAHQTLMANRALCEDVLEIKILEEKPLGLCANIEVAPGADVTGIMAEMLYRLEAYLAPAPRFFSLEQMLDRHAVRSLDDEALTRLDDTIFPPELKPALAPLRGREFHGNEDFRNAIIAAIGPEAWAQTGDLLLQTAFREDDSHLIFNGPVLNSGFLPDEELERAQRRTVVYKSDIFQILMSVPGVTNVQTLEMDYCLHADDGSEGIKTDNWCLSFECDCKPVLDLNCSQLRFMSGPAWVNPPLPFVLERLAQIRMENAPTLVMEKPDLPVPAGEYFPDLADFRSIQEDFPLLYKIGRNGVEKNDSPLRKAQAKQLKSWLLIFDQLMGNYLAYLASVRELLSLERAEDKIALFQPLYDTPGMPELLLDFNLPADAKKLKPDWEQFQKKPDNAYVQTLKRVVEPKSKNWARRQAVMDHLLARFAEQFTDFGINLFRSVEVPSDAKAASLDLPDELLYRKQILLEKIAEISHDRAGGFNYRPPVDDAGEPDIWHTENIEGLKKRVSALLAMPGETQNGRVRYLRKTITCPPQFFSDIFPIPKSRPAQFRFGLKPEESGLEWWLQSVQTYRNRAVAEADRQKFVDMSANPDAYKIISGSDTLHYIVFNAGSEMMMSSPEGFETPELAQKRLDALLKLITPVCFEDDFHVVEHILLRPRDKYYPLLDPLNCCVDCGECLDPYSFRISVIVPGWAPRFADALRFRHFCQTVRAETPAHISVQICRLDRSQMYQFELAYYNWLYEQGKEKPDSDAVRAAATVLINLLNSKKGECGDPVSIIEELPACIELQP